MRKAAAVALMLLAFASQLTAAMSERKQALISEVIGLTGESDIAQIRSARAIAEVFGTPDRPDFNTDAAKLLSDPDLKKQVTAAVTSLYDRHFSEQQLEQLLAFLKSDVGTRFRQVLSETPAQVRTDFAAEIARRAPKSQEDARRRRTMADIRFIATAVEARATDVNRYPGSMTMDELAHLLEPTYIRKLPRKDPWGNDYRFVGEAGGMHYRILSGGPDGTVERGNLTTSGVVAGSDDIIFQDGAFIQPKTP